MAIILRNRRKIVITRYVNFCFRLNRLMMAVPNIQTIDIANIRENSSRPTTDVKFIFVDKDSGEKLELNAHKLILAYVTLCGNGQHALKISPLKIPPKSFHKFSDSHENEDGLKVLSPTFKTGNQHEC